MTVKLMDHEGVNPFMFQMGDDERGLHSVHTPEGRGLSPGGTQYLTISNTLFATSRFSLECHWMYWAVISLLL